MTITRWTRRLLEPGASSASTITGVGDERGGKG